MSYVSRSATTIIGTLEASYCDHGLFIGRYETVLLHFYLTGVRQLSDKGRHGLSERIRKMATPWSSSLWLALSEMHDESTADRLVNTYAHAFPDYWSRSNSAARTVRDIALIEQLNDENAVAADVFENTNGQLMLQIYPEKISTSRICSPCSTTLASS